MLLRLLAQLNDRPVVASLLGIHKGNMEQAETNSDTVVLNGLNSPFHSAKGDVGDPPRCRSLHERRDGMKTPFFRGRWRRHVGPLFHHFDTLTPCPAS